MIIMVVLTTAVWQADAKGHAGKDISVTNLRFDIESDHVEIEFEISAGKKAAKRGRTLIITPVLKSDGGKRELPFVVVNGRASKAAVQRHAMSAGAVIFDSGISMKNGGNAVYEANFPFEDWMEGAHLGLEGIDAGCCDSRRVEIGMIARQVMVTKGFDIVEVPVQLPVIEKLSTAEKLALDFPFIIPVMPETHEITSMRDAEIFDDSHPAIVRSLTETRDNTLTIYFHQSDSRIDYSYADNNASLVKLISAVRAIEESGDSRIARVMIAGFASPEGTAEFNERLARERALAVKAFLNEKSPVYGDMVTIYNGREDWQGLRELIEASDMPNKREVLDIIDNTPVWDTRTQTGRRATLMNLRGGDPYRYMFREFFPLLRNAAYIKIYYENIAPH